MGRASVPLVYVGVMEAANLLGVRHGGRKSKTLHAVLKLKERRKAQGK